MKRRLKIAIYSGVIPSTTFIERLIKGLSEKGHLIYLFGRREDKSYVSNSNIILFTFSNRLSKVIQYLKYSLLLFLFRRKDKKKLDRFIREDCRSQKFLKVKYYPILYHQPDIFHLQWAKGVEEWLWVREFGIKFVLSLRGAHINYSPITIPEYAEKYKRTFPFVDGFHAVSGAIKNEAVKYNANPLKINVVYSGLDLNDMKMNLKSKKTKSKLNIVSVGRKHWIKGYTDALKCMSQLKSKEVDFRYSIVGVGVDEELILLRKQLDLENEVKFVGKLSLQKTLEYIRLADVLLLSSLKEGVANVVLEAMALGTLVVSTDCGGIDEVIKNGENGLLVPLHNIEEMANALNQVNSLSEEAYIKIIKSARVTIEDNHNHVQMVDQMCDLYTNVLN